MKKFVFVILICLVSPVFAQAQNNQWDELAPLMSNYCIALLGRPVPNDFTRVDSTTFRDARGTLVSVRNNQISSSSVGATFPTAVEAARFFMAFHRFFERSWESVSERDGDYYIFFKDGVYAILNAPPMRQGAQLLSSVIFSKTLD